MLENSSENVGDRSHSSNTLLLTKLWNYIPNMAQPKHLHALSAATLRLLRPLVRILLRNNVSHRTFAELAKLVYVEVANAEFGIAGKKKQTISRIAILSGLTRKEVQRLLAHPPDTESVAEEEYHRGSRVTQAGYGILISEMGRAILTRFGWKGARIIQ